MTRFYEPEVSDGLLVLRAGSVSDGLTHLSEFPQEVVLILLELQSSGVLPRGNGIMTW